MIKNFEAFEIIVDPETDDWHVYSCRTGNFLVTLTDDLLADEGALCTALMAAALREIVSRELENVE